MVGLASFAIILGGWFTNRFFFSCTWLARDMTELPLHGDVHVSACHRTGISASVALTMDSAATADASADASRNPHYRRIEEMPDSLKASPRFLKHIPAMHGWYFAIPDRPNGGFLWISLDTDTRSLSIDSAWF